MTETGEQLFPYQLDGARWLASKRVGLLADEMGLGKSAQAIHACDLNLAERILVICPANGVVQWAREFKKFGTRSIAMTAITALKQLSSAQGSLAVSYDLAMLSGESLRRPWDCLILDESHYLKNLTAKRTKAVLGKGGLIHFAKKTWFVTGTPAPNHAGELWPMLKVTGVTPLNYEAFIERFCNYYTSGYKQKQITGTKVERIPEIKSMLAKIMLRRRKEEVMTELPPIHYSEIVVQPGDFDLEQQSSFVQYLRGDGPKFLQEKLARERALLQSIDSEINFGTQNGFKALEAVAESVSTLRRYCGLQKIVPVIDLVTAELKSKAYEKVVIFAIHRDVIEGLRNGLQKFKPVTLYGGTPPMQRQKNVDKFQNTPQCRVFIGNIQAAGTGVTLTAAHNVIFAEQEWVPSSNTQAAMRCHRIGQTKPVIVRFIALADSIDEKITTVVKRKTRELIQIFDEG